MCFRGIVHKTKGYEKKKGLKNGKNIYHAATYQKKAGMYSEYEPLTHVWVCFI